MSQAMFDAGVVRTCLEERDDVCTDVTCWCGVTWTDVTAGVASRGRTLHAGVASRGTSYEGVRGARLEEGDDGQDVGARVHEGEEEGAREVEARQRGVGLNKPLE